LHHKLNLTKIVKTLSDLLSLIQHQADEVRCDSFGLLEPAFFYQFVTKTIAFSAVTVILRQRRLMLKKIPNNLAEFNLIELLRRIS